MGFSVAWIITGNAMKQFFEKMEAAKETYKYRSIAEILTLLISMFSSKCMVNFIKVHVRSFALCGFIWSFAQLHFILSQVNSTIKDFAVQIMFIVIPVFLYHCAALLSGLTATFKLFSLLIYMVISKSATTKPSTASASSSHSSRQNSIIKCSRKSFCCFIFKKQVYSLRTLWRIT